MNSPDVVCPRCSVVYSWSREGEREWLPGTVNEELSISAFRYYCPCGATLCLAVCDEFVNAVYLPVVVGEPAKDVDFMNRSDFHNAS